MTEPAVAARWNVDAPFYDFEVALRLVSGDRDRDTPDETCRPFARDDACPSRCRSSRPSP